ncbi:MAG: hypothetical protein Q8N26_36400 [Myxococcales bacterium]|nr:hypothetical protein [Myxococcales bacterium]
MPHLTSTCVVMLLSVTALAAPTVEQCVTASTAAQREQKNGSYLAAKRQLQVCASSQCPAVVENDCTKWLAEVLASMPSLVVVARVDGVDQRQARVLLDGHLWQAELSGRPEDIEPGAHELTVTVGTQTRLQRLLINVGEKNRLVVFDFSTTVQVEPTARAARSVPVLPLVLSGVAVAGVATFSVLGLTGRASLEALSKQECASTKSCNPSQVANVQRQFLIADVSLGVGVVSALFAAWQWWAWASAPVTVSFDGQRATVFVTSAF